MFTYTLIIYILNTSTVVNVPTQTLQFDSKAACIEQADEIIKNSTEGFYAACLAIPAKQ